VVVTDFEFAQVEEGCAERPLANHLKVRVTKPVEEIEHFQRNVASGCDFARHDVMRRHADQDRDDTRRIVDLMAQLARPGVGSTNLRHRVAAAGLHAQAVGHLKAEFRRRFGRRVRLGFQQIKAAPREPLGFIVRVEPRGGLCRLIPVFRGPNVVARGFEQQRDLCGAVAGLTAKAPHELLGNQAAERGPARGAQRRVEGVVIDVVREAVPQRELTVVGFVLVHEADQCMLALEPLQRVLDVLLRPLEYRGKHRRVEVHPLDAGRSKESPVVIVERIHLALHETPNRLRQFFLER
jgi:hypothetical protein